MLKNPYTHSIDQDQIKTLAYLTTGQASLKDVFTPDEDGQVSVGKLKLPASVIGDTLDEKVKPTRSMELVIAAQQRLDKIVSDNQKRIDSINTALERKAKAVLLKAPVTKAEMKLAELRDSVVGLELLNNPLRVGHHVQSRTDEKGTLYQVRIAGTAIVQLLPGETKAVAYSRLERMVLDDTELLCSLAGMSTKEANIRAIRRGVFPYRGELPENQAGVIVGYAFTFSDVGRLVKCVQALQSVGKTIHVIDPTMLDSASARLNLTPEEEVQQVESDLAELDQPEELNTEDLAAVI